MSDYIYLIESRLNDEVSYKIGYTKRAIKERLSEIETHNPGVNKVVALFESKHGRKVESFLHRIFKSKQIKLEWFNLTSEDVENFQPFCKRAERSFTTLKEHHNPYI